MTFSLAYVGSLSGFGHSQAGDAEKTIVQVMGAVNSVQADSIGIHPDSGGDVSAKLTPSTRMLRVPPGEKDLKNAVPLAAAELAAGDRVLVRGVASADGNTITALSMIVMKQAEISAKRQAEMEDWQKRGVSGLVTALDATGHNLSLTSGGISGQSVAVHTSAQTIFRRYMPGSVKFDDAKPSSFDQIRIGDQLRVKGTRTGDGSSLAAEEIVFGTFRSIAGTVTGLDAASHSLTVQDDIVKSPVVVSISPDSQVKKLPPELARRIAMRLHGDPRATDRVSAGDRAGIAVRRPGPSEGNGSLDLQRFIGRLPAATLADLQKGDAVMILSTAAEQSGTVTAITLLAGVEPLLTAAPGKGTPVTLSPWTLGASSEGDAGP
jgi:hypothetical protein